MKTINYTGSSKLISRIVHLLNRKAPLPLDGDGDAVWGTNGQVLTTDGNGNTYWGEGGGGDVTDVEVNGTSVVNAQGVAEVSVPTKTSDLTNDSGFITSADVPTKTSDLTNDSGFITNLVNNLANYYTKSQTYTQAEVNALISGIVTLNILVVQTLPTQDISTTTIYLVPKQDAGTDDIYDEYLYINNAWELIGTTQIDLSNYVTTTDLSTALADYVTSVGLATILADYVQSSDLATVATSGSYNDLSNKPTIPTALADLSEDTTHRVVTDTEKTTWNGKVSDNPTFTEASTRANIASGESFATILGKIKKFFTDLKTVAFTGSYNDLSDKPTIPTVTKTVYYGTCTGQAANQTKAVVVDSSQGFALTAGIILLVKFDANNTYSATAAAPVKLNVNSTGAKNIYYAASNAPTGTNTTAFGRTNYVNQYYYDGTNWIWSGSSADNNTTYSNMSANELTTGTATTARSISAKVLTDWLVAKLTNVAYKNSANTFNQHQTIDRADGTTSAVGGSNLVLGNNKAAGTAGNSQGQLYIYGEGSAYSELMAPNATANRYISFPDKSGTVALTSYIWGSSDAYSSSKAYAVGDYCIYNDTLYRCVTACSAASWSVNSSCFTADTVVGAITAIEEVLDGKVLASVTANGSKTYGTLLNELYSAVDMSKIRPWSVFVFETSGSKTFITIRSQSSELTFSTVTITSARNALYSERWIVSSDSKYWSATTTSSSTTFSDNTSVVAPNGMNLSIIA